MIRSIWFMGMVLVLAGSVAVGQVSEPNDQAPANEQAGVGEQAQSGEQVRATENRPTGREIRLVDRPGEIVAVLDNGMAVIVKENHTAPVATVRLYVRAGSIYEQNKLGAGLTHLCEHLLAGGQTENRSETESTKLLEQIGGQYNAYTGKARTCYYITAPAQHVGTALNLIADWITRPRIGAEAFERELGVVQRELEMKASSPAHVQWYLFDELRYKMHPGRYPIIGYQAIVRQLQHEDVMEYYRRQYVPDNVVVAIVGDINAAEMLAEVRREFGDFERQAISTVDLPAEPEVTGPRRVVKVLAALKGPAKMMVGFPSFALQHEDLYALDMLANIMGSGQSSRLYRVLREEKQLVLSIEAWNYTPSWAAGTFTIACDMAPEKVGQVEGAIWEQIELIKADGVSVEELERAKRQLQVGHIRRHQTADQQATTMGGDYLATGDAHFSDRYVAAMGKVTAQKVQEMARKYLLADKQLTLVLTPTALPVAAEQAVAGPSESAMKKATLDNGLRVLLKRNSAVPLVNVQLYVTGGLLAESEANNGITSLMAQVSKKGTTNYSAEEIVDYFDGIGGSLSTGSGNNTYFYVSEFMSGDFGKAFEIFSEVVLEPTFPEAELEKDRQRALATIAQIDNTWHRAASKFFREKFFVNSPYRRTSTGSAEAVGALTAEQVRSFHEAGTVGSRAVLAIVGDIDLAEVEKVVREKFAGMAQGVAFDLGQFAAEPPVVGARRFVKQTAKPGATVFVGYPGIRLTDIEDRYAMGVLMEVLGSNTGWLHELLRGRQYVYYAWGYSHAGLVPGFVAATAQCEADKAATVLELIEEQLAKAARGEISEAEVANAKSKQINAEVLGKQTNADAAATAALDELYGFGYEWSESQADRIMAVTLADVQRVANKYLSGPATVTVITSEPGALESAGQD